MRSYTIFNVILLSIVFYSCGKKKQIEVGFNQNAVINNDGESYLLEEGSHWIPASHRAYVYDLKEQKESSQVQARTLDDSLINLSFTFRIKLVKDSLRFIHKTIGQEYQRHYVVPSIQASVREYFSQSESEIIKQLQLKSIEKEIMNLSVARLSAKGIRLTLFSVDEIELNRRIRVMVEKVE